MTTILRYLIILIAFKENNCDYGSDEILKIMEDERNSMDRGRGDVPKGFPIEWYVNDTHLNYNDNYNNSIDQSGSIQRNYPPQTGWGVGVDIGLQGPFDTNATLQLSTGNNSTNKSGWGGVINTSFPVPFGGSGTVKVGVSGGESPVRQVYSVGKKLKKAVTIESPMKKVVEAGKAIKKMVSGVAAPLKKALNDTLKEGVVAAAKPLVRTVLGAVKNGIGAGQTLLGRSFPGGEYFLRSGLDGTPNNGLTADETGRQGLDLDADVQNGPNLNDDLLGSPVLRGDLSDIPAEYGLGLHRNPDVFDDLPERGGKYADQHRHQRSIDSARLDMKDDDPNASGLLSENLGSGNTNSNDEQNMNIDEESGKEESRKQESIKDLVSKRYLYRGRTHEKKRQKEKMLTGEGRQLHMFNWLKKYVHTRMASTNSSQFDYRLSNEAARRRTGLFTFDGGLSVENFNAGKTIKGIQHRSIFGIIRKLLQNIATRVSSASAVQTILELQDPECGCKHQYYDANNEPAIQIFDKNMGVYIPPEFVEQWIFKGPQGWQIRDNVLQQLGQHKLEGNENIPTDLLNRFFISSKHNGRWIIHPQLIKVLEESGRLRDLPSHDHGQVGQPENQTPHGHHRAHINYVIPLELIQHLLIYGLRHIEAIPTEVRQHWITNNGHGSWNIHPQLAALLKNDIQYQHASYNYSGPTFNYNYSEPISSYNYSRPIFNYNYNQPIYGSNYGGPMFNYNYSHPIFGSNYGGQTFNYSYSQPTYGSNYGGQTVNYSYSQPTYGSNYGGQTFNYSYSQPTYGSNYGGQIFNYSYSQPFGSNYGGQIFSYNYSQPFGSNYGGPIYGYNYSQPTFGFNYSRPIFNYNYSQPIFGYNYSDPTLGGPFYNFTYFDPIQNIYTHKIFQTIFNNSKPILQKGRFAVMGRYGASNNEIIPPDYIQTWQLPEGDIGWFFSPDVLQRFNLGNGDISIYISEQLILQWIRNNQGKGWFLPLHQIQEWMLQDYIDGLLIPRQFLQRWNINMHQGTWRVPQEFIIELKNLLNPPLQEPINNYNYSHVFGYNYNDTNELVRLNGNYVIVGSYGGLDKELIPPSYVQRWEMPYGESGWFFPPHVLQKFNVTYGQIGVYIPETLIGNWVRDNGRAGWFIDLNQIQQWMLGGSITGQRIPIALLHRWKLNTNVKFWKVPQAFINDLKKPVTSLDGSAVFQTGSSIYSVPTSFSIQKWIVKNGPSGWFLPPTLLKQWNVNGSGIGWYVPESVMDRFMDKNNTGRSTNIPMEKIQEWMISGGNGGQAVAAEYIHDETLSEDFIREIILKTKKTQVFESNKSEVFDIPVQAAADK